LRCYYINLYSWISKEEDEVRIKKKKKKKMVRMKNEEGKKNLNGVFILTRESQRLI